jgi:hypothetical protein
MPGTEWMPVAVVSANVQDEIIAWARELNAASLSL